MPGRLVGSLVFAAAAAAGASDPWTRSRATDGIDPALVVNPIAITPEIRAAAATLGGGDRGSTVDQLKRTQSALYDTSRFSFDYDAEETLTAAETLVAGRGNCVAF